MSDDSSPIDFDRPNAQAEQFFALVREMEGRCPPEEQRAMGEVEHAWLVIEAQAALNRRAIAAGGRALPISREAAAIVTEAMHAARPIRPTKGR
ncbi:MAG: hypothetical protein M0P31_17650 [Solirubrobacteraceae bacterium]|nr:hypothetical protein [Solirubrobacteraceae bacterium]